MKLGYLLLALTLAGCEWFERELEWKQEARLQDGRILLVDRVSRVTGKRFPEGGNYDIYQALSFTHPDTGERLSWAPPEGSGPVMVDVDGPNAYFIVEAISVGDYNRLPVGLLLAAACQQPSPRATRMGKAPGGDDYDQSSGFEAAAYRTGDENRIAYRRRYDGGVDRDRTGYSGADAIDAGVCMPFARLMLGDAIGIMAPTRNRPLPRVAA